MRCVCAQRYKIDEVSVETRYNLDEFEAIFVYEILN